MKYPDRTKVFMAHRQIELHGLHSVYAKHCQGEGKQMPFMVKHGHPFAGTYSKLRTYFDSLEVCCNDRAKLMSYRDSHEQVQYWAPELRVTNEPKDFGEFGRIYPNHINYQQYIQACADTGWPENVEPRLDVGDVIIYSRNAKLIGEVFGIIDGAVLPKLNESEAGVFELHIYSEYRDRKGLNYEKLDAIVECVSRRNPRWYMPRLER